MSYLFQIVTFQKKAPCSSSPNPKSSVGKKSLSKKSGWHDTGSKSFAHSSYAAWGSKLIRIQFWVANNLSLRWVFEEIRWYVAPKLLKWGAKDFGENKLVSRIHLSLNCDPHISNKNKSYINLNECGKLFLHTTSYCILLRFIKSLFSLIPTFCH